MSILFSSFWFGEALPPIEHVCVKSFLWHGHRFRLYAFDEVANVPVGCELADASTVVDRDRLFLHTEPGRVGSPSGFSNLFRYELLRQRGGWWVDSDMLCLRPDLHEAEYVFAPEDDEGSFNPAVLRAPPHSALFEEAARRASDVVERQHGKVAFNVTGPWLFHDLVKDVGLEAHAWPKNAFFPVHWRETFVVCDPRRRQEVERRVANSMFLHLWTSMFTFNGVPRTALPPKGSYLHSLFGRYEVTLPQTRYDWRRVVPPTGLVSRARYKARRSAAKIVRLRGRSK